MAGSKWQLHVKVLAVIGVVVGAIAAMLLSSAQGHGLEGLGAALVGGMLLIALLAHAVVSTIVVAFIPDRRGVAIAHVALPVTFIAVATAFIAVG